MRPPSAKVVCILWGLAAAVFVGSLVTFLVLVRNNILDHARWWSPGSLAGGVTWYSISGWCLIPLPFVLAAIAASLIRAAVKPGDTEVMHWGLKVFLWVIGILIVGAMLLFLIWFLMFISGPISWR